MASSQPMAPEFLVVPLEKSATLQKIPRKVPKVEYYGN
jgi:hypothetical protein